MAITGPRWTGKPLQIAVHSVPGTIPGSGFAPPGAASHRGTPSRTIPLDSLWTTKAFDTRKLQTRTSGSGWSNSTDVRRTSPTRIVAIQHAIRAIDGAIGAKSSV